MYLVRVIIAALAALGFAAFNFFKVKKMDEGTSEMKEIASAIRVGANAFINYEYKILYLVVVIVAVVMAVITSWTSAAALIIGSTICSIMPAIFCGNSGGVWDNGKKHIEQGGVEGAKKGDEAHAAGVVGDTVGDPLKDTVGPCLDIFIKIMSTVSLVAVAVFDKYNLFDLIFK